MPAGWLSELLRLVLFVAAGGLLGWLYGETLAGLLAASLIALALHLRQLLRLDAALRSGQRIPVPEGRGIWAQVLARVAHQRQRVRKHKRRHRQLLKEIRASTNAIPDGGIVLNGDGEITFYNDAAVELVGLRPKRDRGQRVDNLIRHPEFVAYLRAGRYDEPVTIPSPVDEDVWLSCRIVPYGAGQQLLLVRDITEQTRLARMRRDFVANASHELRSPLTVISGYLDSMVLDPQLPEAWQRPLNEMCRQAVRMNNIMTELLELSRVETATSASMERFVDVAALARDVAEEAASADDAPEIRLSVDRSFGLYGNGSDLQSVLGNLVSNAVRHTPPDGEVEIVWRREGDDARLSVRDSGEGIAESDLPRLTERFFRVDRGRSRGQGGVGLGLAIVKHALARHGAELEIESRVGAGSVFSCRFPAQRVAPVPDQRSALA